jgi:hypothetical protein
MYGGHSRPIHSILTPEPGHVSVDHPRKSQTTIIPRLSPGSLDLVIGPTIKSFFRLEYLLYPILVIHSL